MSSTPSPNEEILSIVLLEDSDADAEIEELALERAGIRFQSRRVQTQAEFVEALRTRCPDVVLADHALPDLDGPGAVSLARKHCPHTSVIVVSGQIGEDEAVETLKAGATDYILKDRLARLAPAVRRAVEESRERRRRLELEEQVRQAQKLEVLGRLAGGVAHDFNNLLTIINGYSNVLLKGADAQGAEREPLEEIRKAGERATALTRQLLAFSRKQEIAPRPVNLNRLIHGVEDMLRRLIGEHVQLTSRLSPTLGTVVVDPGQMEQVVMNLTVNARDAIPEGGEISIATVNERLLTPLSQPPFVVPPGDYVKLSVSDTGVGMTDTVRARLLEPFFTTKDEGQGTGLGLSLVKNVVTQAGGHLFIVSAPGKGSVVEVYLPLASETEGRNSPAEPVVAPPGNGETILIVEDSASVRSLVREVLRSQRYRTLEAVDGEDALRRIHEHTGPLDMVVTDLLMPRLGGVELATRLSETHPNAAVLFLSGISRDMADVQGLLDSEAVFLEKPFSPDALLAKARQALDARDA